VARMENLALIVGLGNPGAEYARTRHNVGFMLVEELARRWQAEWETVRKFEARVAMARRPTGRVAVCQPLTFMNASGTAVRAMMDYWAVPCARVLVSVDDADLPLGELRLRPRGSSGGHHGLESLEQHLGTRDFARQRIGIGRQGAVREITGHVLGRFSAAEAVVLKEILSAAGDQAECWLDAGLQKAMNEFNGAVIGPTNEETKL
jgi:peptidyl-tRNA hydrolase, PTH1 family